MKTILAALCVMMSAPVIAFADMPEIVKVKVSRIGMDWRFAVTLRHGDTGWDHFADAWEIVSLDGKVLATRELMHPHVAEQPFTRSLTGVMLPDGTRDVLIRARCSDQGWGEATYRVTLPF
ncbi:hypothetical protein [Pseudoprimorskyibacter insulae]|uniref:Uncharacterized protein n=1 Tax=Pseudoprimorskyibacter insulae TaxID=1695997 RepID=A0A2R8AZ40_9RHOB|nr:hypothetical protein [Pseudoprimorskyibacter insulae]SPF81237.1 hypothetical protein PRI8871_03059 [Pseudoprimorskyibacter insulae]